MVGDHFGEHMSFAVVLPESTGNVAKRVPEQGGNGIKGAASNLGYPAIVGGGALVHGCTRKLTKFLDFLNFHRFYPGNCVLFMCCIQCADWRPG